MERTMKKALFHEFWGRFSRAGEGLVAGCGSMAGAGLAAADRAWEPRSYIRPDALILPVAAEQVLCVSTGTEPFEDNGNYDWGSQDARTMI